MGDTYEKKKKKIEMWWQQRSCLPSHRKDKGNEVLDLTTIRSLCIKGAFQSQQEFKWREFHYLRYSQLHLQWNKIIQAHTDMFIFQNGFSKVNHKMYDLDCIYPYWQLFSDPCKYGKWSFYILPKWVDQIDILNIKDVAKRMKEKCIDGVAV